MLQDTLPGREKQIEAALEHCIRAANRNLAKWNSANINRNHYKPMDNAEVKGLFINWFTRHMKAIIGHTAVSAIMRDGKPIVELNMAEHYITKVTLSDPYGWAANRYANEHTLIKRVLLGLPYNSLKYDPIKDEPVYSVASSPLSISSINFDGLNAIYSNLKK